MLPQWSSLFTHLLLPVGMAVHGLDGKQGHAQHLTPRVCRASQVRSFILDSSPLKFSSSSCSSQQQQQQQQHVQLMLMTVELV